MKRIKWYNIIYLVFNVYAVWLLFATMDHIGELERTEIIKCRLGIITLICFIAMICGSFLLRKMYSMKKEMR